ncbi:MAG: hypothetical protein LAN64_15040 [Acidobacteriia bacterium]|nr:hypothetical protein [Terriglobia bacterium]
MTSRVGLARAAGVQPGISLAPQHSEADREVAREILRYFARNPGAADTMEGIAHFRLLDERIHSGLEQVTRALALLVSEGLLVREAVARSAEVFRLNQEQPRAIERFLEKAEQ